MGPGNSVGWDRTDGVCPCGGLPIVSGEASCAEAPGPSCARRCKSIREFLDVNSGQVKLGREDVVLRSLAIGSCIAVVAYDPLNRLGALAHVMLPGQARPSAAEKTRYAADALEELGAIMTEAGSRLNDVDICLVGAGNVLQRRDDTICASNISSVKEILRRKRIPIRAAVLGGTERKGVCLCVKTGRVSHTVGDSEYRLLWEPHSTSARETGCGDPGNEPAYD